MDTKKKILTIIIIILLITELFLGYLLFKKFVLKNQFEKQILSFANKNEKTVFTIDKILFFSNCDASNKTNTAHNFTIENLYQYTDMAIFINTNETEKNLENTFKSVIIKNIKFNKLPSLGEPNLYFKGLNQFAKSDINEENIIQDALSFNITSENEANLDTPTLYNNLANPITLSYVNNKIKSDYTILDTSSPITYDGSLLKKCNISLDSISCNVSFDIYITNNKNEEFECTVFIDIPLSDKNTTLYDGKVISTKFTNFKFYRYK